MHFMLAAGAALAGLALWLMKDLPQAGWIDGRTFWTIAASLAVLAIAVAAAFALASQVRGRHRYSDQVRQLVEESEASKDEMAKYLQQQVGTLKVLLEAVDLSGPGDAAQRQMWAVLANIDVLGEKLSNIRDLARLRSGTYPVAVTRVDLGILLRECEQAFRSATACHGLDWIVSPTSAWVLTDPTMLRRILRNLLHNAIKFTVSGVVAISCKIEGDKVTITVRDSGVGMHAQELARLFAERRKRTQELAGNQAASGTGLEVVQRMASVLGHKFDVRSTRGQGSDFSIILPRASTQPGERRKSAR